MKALVYEAFKGELSIQTVPDPDPLNHGVVLQTLATGICRSDWHGWMGHDSDITLPHVPGHELAGEVVAIGKKVKKFKLGDRVTVPFVCGCGNCAECDSGNHQVCDHQSQPGFTHWGSFAELVRIDYADTNLVRIPDEIEDVTAAALGCRFITAFRALVDQAQLSSGQYVAIYGCGGVGLSAVMIARALGAQIIAVDINEKALALASKFGAQTLVNAATSTNIVDEVKSHTQGGAHVSLDALGSAQTCEHSIRGLRKRGRHIQVGLMTNTHRYPKIPMHEVLANELEIIGSHGMQAHRYPEMLAMIKQGVLQPQRLVNKAITLEEAPRALTSMDSFEHSGITIIDSFS